jgi:predicted RNase H-like HicB family nuclease
MQDLIKIDFKKKEFKASLETLVIKEKKETQFVAIVPSLNLSSYGNTQKEALNRLFEDVIKPYFDELLELGERKGFKELKAYGWEKNKIFKKQFSSAHVDTDGVLKNLEVSEDSLVSKESVLV